MAPPESDVALLVPSRSAVEKRLAAQAQERTPAEPARRRVAARGGWYAERGKRLLDLALVLGALPLVLPLALLAALATALSFRDPRRVFFVQERVGRGGERFRIVKFRTMTDPLRDAMSSWSEGRDAARVTRLGRLLRNTHLDELPQLWNVLRGDMSLIGPRPEMVEVALWAEGCVEGFAERLVVRPGLTGLAQILQGYTGRDARAYRRKLALDRRYLERQGFGLDLWILVRTVGWVLRARGWKSWCRASARAAGHGEAREGVAASSAPAARPESARRAA